MRRTILIKTKMSMTISTFFQPFGFIHGCLGVANESFCSVLALETSKRKALDWVNGPLPFYTASSSPGQLISRSITGGPLRRDDLVPSQGRVPGDHQGRGSQLRLPGRAAGGPGPPRAPKCH